MDKLIYPVPPIKGNNYLGIHTTITTDGKVKIGPSAIPIFNRDKYTFNPLHYNAKEAFEICIDGLKALTS